MVYDHSNDPWFKSRCSLSEAETSEAPKAKPVPPYLKRAAGFKAEDFGDGGAFPEYSLGGGMGRRSTNQKQPGGKTLPLTVDERGNNLRMRYDAIVKQNENAKKIVYSEHHTDLFVNDNDEDDEMDVDGKQQKEIDETTQNTKAALEKIVNVRFSAAQPPKNIVPTHESSDSIFIKYKPSQQQSERIIRMVEMPEDPLEPPKFKHKRFPKASGSPPVPVMHSPPPPVTTVKDQQDWKKIPPCISNWKNPKGYTIPLDKRLGAAADGRRWFDQINDYFAKLSEALYVAEQKAREAVAVRSKVQKEMLMKEKEKKEMELRELARKARSEKKGVAPPSSAMPMPSSSSFESRGGAINYNDDMISVDYNEDVVKESREERGQLLQRAKIREERHEERERERRLEAAKDAATRKKRRKITRDRDRDISEKVALGMASAGARGGEVMYDQRLFNQEKGMMDSGFATDDAYNIYDKSLFAAGPSAMHTLYRPKKDDADDEMYGGADEKLMKTERFKPDKAFSGTSKRMGTRERPVEFEKDQPPEEEEEDPFGLLQFFEEVKTGKKAMDGSRSGAEVR
ncbi:hypothetical protein BUALT_Bualt08G0064700 [Buddleja alternifolia]|uniref:SKI-interacting protein SKIP SNW domain-containing protein n=1 Tax=Buddleja alternifolia TaxID=168488 RepID=A0AAV6X5P5_9LAMI|nr:hypothetical protein BUALT_Bualt08G0064700 [Buddleja alternifolia]